MKRLCVFHTPSARWSFQPIEWIVCKKCQARLRRGDTYRADFFNYSAPKRMWATPKDEQ